MSATLVLGGARSGKSRHAELLVRETGLKRLYIATAQAFDDEMAARVAQHRATRAADGWTTIEEPLALAEAISKARQPDAAILVDCLTLWLSNIMLAGRDVAPEQDRLLAALKGSTSPIVFVSNEVGLGIVPETPLGRAFRDAQGRLNQALAQVCQRVIFVAAGLPLVLKGA
jgi:adenosylcobinamide kinase / adenosylcobinamide-phosphate guanylyltransferase